MRLLLDTCTFLWLITGDRKLSPHVRSLIADETNEIMLSSISAWEAMQKHGVGKVEFLEDPAVLIPAERRAHGISTLPFLEEDSLLLARLPVLHRDPFDRMLVCQALTNGLTILTPDPQITQYAVPTAW